MICYNLCYNISFTDILLKHMWELKFNDTNQNVSPNQRTLRQGRVHTATTASTVKDNDCCFCLYSHNKGLAAREEHEKLSCYNSFILIS